MQDRSCGGLLLTELATHVDEWLTVSTRSASTREIAAQTLARFVRYAAAHNTTDAAQVTPALVDAFIHAPGVNRQPPAVATMHQRRAVIRLAFRLYHREDPTVVDPTYALALPPRSTLTVRPLTGDEVNVLRAVSMSTLIETRQPAVVALAEAGAVTTEIAAVTAADVDLTAGVVALPGARHATARTVPLTPWGATQLARRCDSRAGSLTYEGAGVGNAAQVSVSVALRRMFRTAGLDSEADVTLGSLRCWAGRRVFDETGRVEDAARVLGCRSLDAAARLIGWEWS